MNWQNLFIIVILIIAFLVSSEIVRLNTLAKCPAPVTEYRYIPRTFKDEQNERIPIEDIFGKMFGNVSPWMMSRGINETGRTKLIDTSLFNRELRVENKVFGKK